MPPSITETLDTPIQSYVRSRQIELAKSFEGRKAIYLDTKFWIILRDVVMGIRDDPTERRLLSLLREAVRTNLAFCPISDTTFAELLKRVDLKSRQVAADLIDELSLGISLVPYHIRAGTELAYFLHFARTPNEVYPPKYLVWTKLAYVLGFVYPKGEAQELLMQKMFFDHMWTISLREMIDRLGDHEFPKPLRFQALAETLNDLNAQHAGEPRSFSQIYDDEVHGMLDSFKDVSVDVMEQIVGKDSGRCHISTEERELIGRQLHNLFFATFEKEATKDALRTFHIMAILNAAIRCNRGQRFKANDFFDFQHASAALGYCDAFVTERYLGSVVTEKHIALDKRYNCTVGITPEDAILYLRGLAGSTTRTK